MTSLHKPVSIHQPPEPTYGRMDVEAEHTLVPAELVQHPILLQILSAQFLPCFLDLISVIGIIPTRFCAHHLHKVIHSPIVGLADLAGTLTTWQWVIISGTQHVCLKIIRHFIFPVPSEVLRGWSV